MKLHAPPPPQLAAPPTPTEFEPAMLRSLSQLDAAVARAARPPLALRLARGITGHFRLRAPEWFAAVLLLQFGYILYAAPDVFPTAPNLAVMAAWAREETWGLCCLTLAGIRLAALTVNGTFPRFRFSPHVRAVSALLACFLWFQVTWAMYLSGVGGTGFGTYRLVLFLELYNVFCACRDTGVVEGRRLGHGR